MMSRKLGLVPVGNKAHRILRLYGGLWLKNLWSTLFKL